MENFQYLAQRHQRLRKHCLVSFVLSCLALVVTLGWFKGSDGMYGVAGILAYSSLAITVAGSIWLIAALCHYLVFRHRLDPKQKIQILLLDEREKHQAIVVHVIGYWFILGFQVLEAIESLSSGESEGFTKLGFVLLFLLIIPARWLYAENKLD